MDFTTNDVAAMLRRGVPRLYVKNDGTVGLRKGLTEITVFPLASRNTSGNTASSTISVDRCCGAIYNAGATPGHASLFLATTVIGTGTLTARVFGYDPVSFQSVALASATSTPTSGSPVVLSSFIPTRDMFVLIAKSDGSSWTYGVTMVIA